ncbi:MAG: helix-turn-helix domain-containing protein [Pseudomonadota bacterium]
MQPKSFSDMQCSIARTLELVGSWWSLLIIRDAMMGARRFKHFEKSLGIAKNTLTSRLTQLVDAGILKKAAAADGAGYEEYVLTPKGRDLAPVMIALAQWGDTWAMHEDGPTFAFVDAETGEKIPRVLPRRETGEVMSRGEFRIERLAASASKKDAGD